MVRPFKFAIQLNQPIPGTSWVDTAKRVEDNGWNAIHVPDHFGDQYAPIAAMAAAAVATSELKVGCLVFDNDYRHPVVLAKEVATINAIAPGRVEMGLGAGWMKWDYETSGMAYDAPKTRVDRFEEGLDVITRLLAGDQVSHDGSFYQLANLPGTPNPGDGPRPAIMVGGGGPRMLKIAATKADIVAVTARIPSGAIDSTAAQDIAPWAVDDKVTWIRSAAGNRLQEIDINSLSFVASVTDDSKSMAEGVAAMFGSGAPAPPREGVGKALRAAAEAGGSANASQDRVFGPEQVLESPATLIGTVDEICERLESRRARWGINYVTLQGFDAVESFAPVIARLRGN